MSSAVEYMSEVGGYQAKTMKAVAILDCPDKPLRTGLSPRRPLL